jgi:hypothetical protein
VDAGPLHDNVMRVAEPLLRELRLCATRALASRSQ